MECDAFVLSPDVGAECDGAHRRRRVQVLGVDGPRADGQRLPHCPQGSLARGQADLGATPQGVHAGDRTFIPFIIILQAF